MTGKELTQRRQQILDFIAKSTTDHGYPPTVREIGEAVGLKSSSSVHFHLRALTELGCLQRDGSLTRALRLTDEAPERPSDTRWLPVVGEVAAGQPVFAVEECEDLVPLPTRFVPNGEAFMLRVEGDSMIDAGIYDGDFVIVSRSSTANEGDIVVALLQDEATVKYFHRRGAGFELRPANESMGPIFVDEVQVLGRVTGILRSFA